MKKFILFFLSLYLHTLSASPRLLLILDTETSFEHEELNKKIECHYLSCFDTELEAFLTKLEKDSANHLVLYDGRTNDLHKLARNVGYDYLLLPKDIDTAVAHIKTHIQSMPLTDADLPHTDPETTGLFYALMMQVDKIFTHHGICYFATCGTLLGAIRHKGMIPWDDDIDICIFDKDVTAINSLKKSLANMVLPLNITQKLDFTKYFTKMVLK